MHHAFLYISLPSLPDYNVKVPEFTFCRGREHKTTTFFSFPELWYSPLEFNSKNICQHLTKQMRWNKRDKVWTGTTSLFNWCFCSRRHRCCLSSLMSLIPGYFHWHKRETEPKELTICSIPRLHCTNWIYLPTWNPCDNCDIRRIVCKEVHSQSFTCSLRCWFSSLSFLIVSCSWTGSGFPTYGKGRG